MDVVFVMFRSDGQRREFSIVRDMTIIGRREDCDLRIPLADVSRKHCRVIKDGDSLRIEDLGSSNGTFHNGERVQEATIEAGDAVRVGPIGFIVQIDGVPASEDIRPPSKRKSPKKSKRTTEDQAAEFLAIGDDEDDPFTPEADKPAHAEDAMEGELAFGDGGAENNGAAEGNGQVEENAHENGEAVAEESEALGGAVSVGSDELADDDRIPMVADDDRIPVLRDDPVPVTHDDQAEADFDLDDADQPAPAAKGARPPAKNSKEAGPAEDEDMLEFKLDDEPSESAH